MSSNFKFTVKNCIVANGYVPVIVHGSNRKYKSKIKNAKKAVFTWDNVEINNYGVSTAISLYSQGCGQINDVIIKQTPLKGRIALTEGVWGSTKLDEQIADHCEFNLQLKNQLAIPSSSVSKGRALRIHSKSTDSKTSVRFDTSSSAFKDIIGKYPQSSSKFRNRFNLIEADGYMYKNGGDGLRAFALSSWSIQESPIGVSKNVYITSLGKRLGDCSEKKKILTVIIDGNSYDIVFNKNYDQTDINHPSKYDNKAIIKEMLAVIGKVAFIDEYDISAEYFPAFKNLKTLKNTHTSSVRSGMGIIVTSPKTFRLTKASDCRIDGIVIDDGAIGELCRCIIGKGTRIYSAAFKTRFTASEEKPVRHRKGDMLGIFNDGIFSNKAKHPLLIYRTKNILEIL